MELEIQIVRDPCQELAKHRVRVFGPGGGNIGRSPDNYWALPDPKAYVSGQHCAIEFRDGSFWLRDTSRNGVFVNDATERVGYGHRTRLDDGDHLRLGLYELAVRLREHGRPIRPLDGTDAQHSVHPGAAHATQRIGLESIPTLEMRAEPQAVESERASAEPPSPLPHSDAGAHRLVRIDRARLLEIGLLPPESQERLVANQFRQIKRTLLANALGKGVPAVAHGRLLMMTSALPGEGKTFSTLNLALSLARERDLEILVVDADVAKPQVSGLFNMDTAPGLLEAVADESVDIESLILRTDVPGLHFLPAGRCEGDVATELLASARMQHTVSRLESRATNRVILFDSPPLLLTNEARVLTVSYDPVVRMGGDQDVRLRRLRERSRCGSQGRRGHPQEPCRAPGGRLDQRRTRDSSDRRLAGNALRARRRGSARGQGGPGTSRARGSDRVTLLVNAVSIPHRG